MDLTLRTQLSKKKGNRSQLLTFLQVVALALAGWLAAAAGLNSRVTIQKTVTDRNKVIDFLLSGSASQTARDVNIWLQLLTHQALKMS